MAGGKLRKLIEESGIKGGGLKSYCVTRWTTSSESVNSVLNLKPVLEKFKIENLLILINTLLDVPLKSGVYARLAKTALSIGQNLGLILNNHAHYRVTEALAETDNADKEEEDEYEDNSFDKSRSRIEKPVRRTINGEIIPDDNVIVLIENVWIENEIDLSNDIILKGIGNIPKDLDDDFIDNEKNNNENIVLTDDETVDDTNGRGILNYNVNDLLDECINEN
ncbi:unnamed protein product [Rhizophagus irregularis]|nr:unnamed protein product [Rhizophagus irregularis]